MKYPLSEREVITQLLDEAERVVREMGQNLEDLRHPEVWDDFDDRVETELQYVRRRLESLNDTPYLLAHLKDLRYMLDRILPPPRSSF